MDSIKGMDKILAKLDKMIDKSALQKAMEDACLMIESDSKRECPTGDTGRLRGSIESDVKTEGDNIIGTVGTNVEYAPYVEYGTGLFSSQGNGRKDVPWFYQDDKGNWHSTSGQHPQPYLHPAFENNKDKINKLIADAIKEGMK